MSSLCRPSLLICTTTKQGHRSVEWISHLVRKGANTIVAEPLRRQNYQVLSMLAVVAGLPTAYREKTINIQIYLTWKKHIKNCLKHIAFTTSCLVNSPCCWHHWTASPPPVSSPLHLLTCTPWSDEMKASPSPAYPPPLLQVVQQNLVGHPARLGASVVVVVGEPGGWQKQTWTDLVLHGWIYMSERLA